MRKSNVHAGYSHPLTREQDGNPSVLLHGREQLRLSIARPKRYLYLLSGQVTLSLFDGSTLLFAADNGNTNPLPVASAEPVVAQAHERSNLFDVDAKAVDELHAWDALSDSIDDVVVLRRM